jgi:tetratricopeptide (TPR) repeat protein
LTFRENMRKVNLILFFIMLIIFLACSGPETIRKGNNRIRLSNSEVDSGNRLYRRGCYRQSLSHFFRAFELFASSDRLRGTAMCLNNIGNVYHSLDDTETALSFYNEAYSTYRTLGDQKNEIHSLTNIAAALIDCNQLSKAEEVLINAENIANQVNISFPPLLTNKGILLTKIQKYDKAQITLTLALKKTDPEAAAAIAPIHFALGTLMMKTNRYAEAISFFHKALRADQETSFHKGIADDLTFIGDSLIFLGKQKEAASYYKRGIMIYALINKKEKKLETIKKLAVISEQEGADLFITNFFIEKWQNNGVGNAICN